MKNDVIAIWSGGKESHLPSNMTEPKKIAEFAQQLTLRERTQVIKSYKDGSYEIATTFVWGKAMASLKRELGNLGVTFLAELLGRTDIDDDDNVLEVITEKEAIRLAEELGIVSSTEALRLRHTQELVAHFSQRESIDDAEPMLVTDAINVLSSCVRSILAKPKIQVAKDFAKFRNDLESRSFVGEEDEISKLESSPYFFRKLSVAVLLTGIKTKTGAKLEHCLSNINLLLPRLWKDLRDPERWQIGTVYSQVYADGLQAQSVGLKQALLKVGGFDYVPETLRSQAFLGAAKAIVQAHDGLNNFYNEPAVVNRFEMLGSIIPAPAFGPCMTALLCVELGNSYGVSFSAQPVARRILKKQSADRWASYFERVLPGDVRILQKILDESPRKRWMSLIAEIDPHTSGIKNKLIRDLISASRAQNSSKANAAAQALLNGYYASDDAI
jgi:hypothetical protein